MTESSQAASTPPPVVATKKPRRWKRRLRNFVLGLAVFIILARFLGVALLPSYLDRLARTFGLTCSVGRIELSALSGELEVAHLSVSPIEGGEPILALGYLRADISTRALLTGDVVIRRLEVDGLDLAIDREKDGEWALEKRLAAYVTSKTAT